MTPYYGLADSNKNKWTDIQRHRVNILFKYHPILRNAYNLAMELRQIFNAKISLTKAMGRMSKWYEKVMALGNNNFRSVIKTFTNMPLYSSTISVGVPQMPRPRHSTLR
ncbi:MAG: transposase [Bacteroides sp.]|nr:transposase [Bacteroides sp.]